jgi:predicted nucleic acid-binding protein
MEQSYLVDTNVLIDYITEKLPTKSIKKLDALFDKSDVFISVINRIELLGYAGYSKPALGIVNDLLNNFIEITLSEEVVLRTIELRKKHKIKLPDAIIASSAIEIKATLLTANISDFANIKKLKVVNSYKL